MPDPSEPSRVEDVTSLCGFGCVATVAKGNQPNEDACRYARIGETQLLAVADGLGSSEGSGAAARAAVEGAIQAARDLPPSVSLRTLFDAAANAVREGYRKTNGDGAQAKSVWQTTLLLVRETEDNIEVGWVGNGGVWYARGDILDAWHAAPETETLAAAWMPLMLPHIALQHGRKALTRTISPQQYDEPSFLTLGKGRNGGDLLLVVTDGIVSWEAMPRGSYKDPHAPGDTRFHLWTGGSERLLFVQERILTFLEGYRASAEASALDVMQKLPGVLTDCLSELHRENMLFDDATIGILATGKAEARLFSDALKTACEEKPCPDCE